MTCGCQFGAGEENKGRIRGHPGVSWENKVRIGAILASKEKAK